VYLLGKTKYFLSYEKNRSVCNYYQRCGSVWLEKRKVVGRMMTTFAPYEILGLMRRGAFCGEPGNLGKQEEKDAKMAKVLKLNVKIK